MWSSVETGNSSGNSTNPTSSLKSRLGNIEESSGMCPSPASTTFIPAPWSLAVSKISIPSPLLP